MKILHISTSDNAGAGMCCLRIHQSLLAVGVESKMVVLHNTQHAKEEYQYGFFKDKLVKFPSKLMRIIGLNLTERNQIEALKKQYHTTYTRPVSAIDLTNFEWIDWADIIHLHWVNNYLDYPSFLSKVRKPIVWTLHDEGFFYGIAHHHRHILSDNKLEKKYCKLKFDAVRRTDNLSIVFLSQMMYHNFKDEKIIEGRRKKVISNSVNTQLFKPEDRLIMRQKYGLNEDKLLFVFISINIADPNKGLDLLSDVLNNLNPEIEILAIGGNPWKKTWKNVHSIGLVKSQKEMCELLSCADYMAMPSYQEAFSQSPMEAMACGLPVVVFPVSGTTELVTDRNGVICDDFTFDALERGVKVLMSRQYDSKEIRQDMIDRFSPMVIADKYVELYKEILV